MNNREIYPNAPVVLTAFEIRHSICSKMTLSGERKIKEILGPGLPMRKQAQSLNSVIAQGVQNGLKPEIAPKFTSRDRTLAVTFFSGSVVVETTDYQKWDDFRETIERAYNARQAVDPTEGIERIGLRYIDEIRVPNEAEAESIDWAHWVDISLLGPIHAAAGASLTPSMIQGLASYLSGEDKTLVLRFGTREGFAVNPAGDLKRPTPSSGAFFLLDIDNFWVPSGEYPRMNSKELLLLADELHAPVRQLFEGLITEDLRNEVLRNV